MVHDELFGVQQRPEQIAEAGFGRFGFGDRLRGRGRSPAVAARATRFAGRLLARGRRDRRRKASGGLLVVASCGGGSAALCVAVIAGPELSPTHFGEPAMIAIDHAQRLLIVLQEERLQQARLIDRSQSQLVRRRGLPNTASA